jgi:hypothetical protein
MGQVLHRDAAQLEIAVRVETPCLESRDQALALGAQAHREASGPVAPPAPEPGEKRLALELPDGVEVPREVADRFTDGIPIEPCGAGPDGSVRHAGGEERFPRRSHCHYRSIVELDRGRLEQVVDAIAERLPGEWLLVGGALAALWLAPRRTTEDVDLVGLGGTTDERLALMQLAGELGLPVEALNSAADFFVRRIEGWRDELEPFRQGARGRIYRPTVTLFVLLKLRRLSEQDLADCLAAVTRARTDRLRFDPGRVLAALGALEPAASLDLARRREQLRDAVAAARPS